MAGLRYVRSEPLVMPHQNQGKAMLVVHHLNDSRSQRILWLLEELGVPYG